MINKNTITILIILLSFNVNAQKDYNFSLDEAISFALLNNRASVNAKKDLAIAQKEKWETISRGLPQINSYFDFNNRLKDPISLIPAEFFGGEKGEFAEVDAEAQIIARTFDQGPAASKSNAIRAMTPLVNEPLAQKQGDKQEESSPELMT